MPVTSLGPLSRGGLISGVAVSAESMSGLAEEAPAAYKDPIVDVVDHAGIGKKVASWNQLPRLKDKSKDGQPRPVSPRCEPIAGGHFICTDACQTSGSGPNRRRLLEMSDEQFTVNGDSAVCGTLSPRRTGRTIEHEQNISRMPRLRLYSPVGSWQCIPATRAG
jgi:hypothetical protein